VRIGAGGTSGGEPTIAGPSLAPAEPPLPTTTSKGSQRLILAATLISALALAGVAVLFLTKEEPAPAAARYVVVSKDDPVPLAGVSTSAAAVSEAPGEPATAPVPAALIGKGEIAGPRKPDPRYFTQVFSRRQGAVQQCFAKDTPGDDVSLQIAFSVDTKGRVTAASLSPGSVAGTPSGQCVLRVAKSVSFGPLTEPANFRIPVQARRR
jgi:hypothetical protein